MRPHGEVGDEQARRTRGLRALEEAFHPHAQDRVQVGEDDDRRQVDREFGELVERGLDRDPLLQRAPARGLDRRPVRERIAERDAEFDDVRAVRRQPLE